LNSSKTVSPDHSPPFNPFLSMPGWAILSLRVFGTIYTLFVCSIALFNASATDVSMAWVALSSAWLIFWTFYPLIFYKPNYGWCHPIILMALLSICNMVPRNTSLFMSGLPEHLMLSDWWPEELNMLFAYGNFVNSLALIAVYVGFSKGPSFPVPRLRPASEPPPRLFVVLLLFLALSFVAFGLYTQLYGGLYSFVKSLAFGMAKKIELADDVEGIGQYTVLIRMATTVAVVWACARKNAFRRPVFCLVALSALAAAYLSEGKRSHMIYPAVLIMLCWMLRNRRVPYLRLAMVGVATILLLGFLGLFRSSNWSDTERLNFDFIDETSLIEFGNKALGELARRTGSDSTYFPILAKVPREEGFLYGRTYLEWGLRFIPRELWPDKPRGVDVQANLAFYGGDWGMPAGAVGEAYWNFHLPGVLLVFFLFGVLKRWLADTLARYPDSPGVMAIYLISLFYFDPSQNGFRTWIYAVIPALAMLWLGGLLSSKRSVVRASAGPLETNSCAGVAP
jgi:oligosaccharide repeat unit polymerase